MNLGWRLSLSRRDLQYLWLLARPTNLLIALLTYVLAAGIDLDWQWRHMPWDTFIGEGLLIVLIMASGYWINDVYDFKIDQVNRPRRAYVGAYISRKKVITAYLTVLAMVAFAALFQPWRYELLNLGCVLILYLYARFFKRAAIIGNLLISVLASAVVVAALLLYAAELRLLWMAIFAFLITFVREVTKDIEDLKGDILFGLYTLPIVVGIRATKWVLLVSTLVLVAACWLPVGAGHYRQGQWPVAYAVANVLAVQLPLLYNLWLLWRASKPRDFAQQSMLLKWLMLTGLLTLLLL